MARLALSDPFSGALPRRIGAVTLSAGAAGPAFSVAALRGQQDAVSAALGTLGLRLPEPGEALAAEGGARAIWTGAGRALVLGPVPEGLDGIAAVTDQTGAQTTLLVEGRAAEVLSRLVPIDLRASALPVGRTARTLVGHVTASVTRVAEEAIEIMVLRSMADTLLEEVAEAAGKLAAREAAAE